MMDRFYQLLRRGRFLFAAFLVAFLVRILPEVLTGPYPIGFDPINYYIPAMLARPSLLTIISSSPSPLYWIVQQSLFNALNPDPVGFVKLLGSILEGLLAASIYAYARRVINLSYRWSFFGALFSATYFIALRISWEEYRLMLGTIFLFVTLIMLNSQGLVPRIFSVITSLAAAVAHEFAAYVLVAILLWKALSFVLSAESRTRGRPLLYFVLLDISIAFGVLLRALDLQYASLTQGFGEGALAIAQLQLSSASILGGFYLWSFLPLLPLVLLAAKFRPQRLGEIFTWAFSTALIIAVIAVVLPGALYIGVRLIIYLAYPMGLLAINVLSKLAKTGDSPSVALKGTMIVTVVIALAMSGSYMVTYPANANPYFSQFNPYLLYVPSSMLQNSVPINDMSSLVTAMRWVHERMDQKSVLVIHEAFEGAAALELGYPFLQDVVVIRLRDVTAGSQQQMVERLMTAASNSGDAGHPHVFTIWWTNGEGWYGISALPSAFQNVFNGGTIGVYSYKR
jgi:hypothetical protein